MSETNILDQSNKKSNYLLLGVFLLVWSINGYFIGGNLLKMVLLILGFGFILVTSFTLPKHKSFVNFGLITFSFLILYWLIAVIRNQKTITVSILVFDVICFLLMLAGYVLAKNLSYLKNVSPKIIIFIAIMSILGGLMFIKYQSQMLLESAVGGAGRAVTEDDESGINVIGIAYANAIVFFILYYFLTYCKVRKWVKWLLFLSMFSIIFVILTTQSRGALIYIALILIIKNFKKLWSFSSLLKSIKVFFFTIIAFIILLYFFPAMQEKLDGTINRFQTLLELSDDVEADQSSYERTLIMKDFFENIGDVIFLGMERYKPYPHNQFIEIIMRWGIFFGLPLIIFSIGSFFKAFKILLKGVDNNPFANLILFIFIFSFFQSLSSMSLEMNRMFWFGLGFLAAISSSRLNYVTNKNIES